MQAVVRVALRIRNVTCMAATTGSLHSSGRAFCEVARPSAFPRHIRRIDPMAGPWGSLHSLFRSVAARPVAAAAFGVTTVGAGVLVASGLGSRRSHCTSANPVGPRPVFSSVSDNTQASDSATEPSATADAEHFILAAGAAMIPHPAKQDKGGEDAYFICESGRCLGVADGVGGWAEIGVDPGLYSRELMDHARDASLFTPPGPEGPQRILEYAHRCTAARGSCTACIICVYDGVLHASNLGDSGFMLVRDGELAFMSPQQQHEFNFPYQLGSADSMADMPAAAQRFSMEVKLGDVVVAATDGVFDNVYPDEAAAMVALAKRNGDSPQAAAAILAAFARSRAVDPTHLSPFAYGAQQLGYRYFGGKLDDITVVCAYIEKGEIPKSGCSGGREEGQDNADSNNGNGAAAPKM